MREGLILDAFDMAVSGKELDGKLLLHFDRGVRYRGHDYQLAPKDHDIQCSMSRKENCWDNVVMEPFFSRFKVELIYVENYKQLAEARVVIFEHIEMICNRVKKRFAIGNVSPVLYEKLLYQHTVTPFYG